MCASWLKRHVISPQPTAESFPPSLWETTPGVGAEDSLQKAVSLRQGKLAQRDGGNKSRCCMEGRQRCLCLSIYLHSTTEQGEAFGL